MPAIALILFGVVLTATPLGLGMTPDSLNYLNAARSLREGGGFVDFSSTWPPLYPVAIASATWLHGDVLASARWMNAGLAAANIILLLLLARRLRWRSEFSMVFVLLVGLQAGFLHSHFLLWSEALFLTFVLSGSLLLDHAVRAPSNRWTWVLLALVTAAAALTRYAGLFLLALNAAMVLAFVAWPFRKRLAGAAALTVASAVPLIAWMVFNRSRGVTAVNLSLGWHPPSTAHLSDLGQTISAWFDLPLTWGLTAFGAILLFSIARVLLAVSRRGRADPTSTAMALSILSYTAFLGLSISVANHYTPLDERILFPMLPTVWLLLLNAANQLPSRWIRWLALGLLSISLVRGANHGWEDWRFTRENGLGLTARHIQHMPVLGWLQTVPPEVRLVSNGPDLCSIYLKRTGEMLPAMYNPTSLAKNAEFESALESITGGPTLVVHFQVNAFRTYLPGPDKLETLSGMQVVYRGPDAVAWIRNAGSPATSVPR